jgi:membrane protease YdiL (CAAX protease family)
MSIDTDWFWLGECAPGLSAIFLTWLATRTSGVFQLLKAVTYWKVNPFYYYLVIVLMAFFYLAAIGVTALQGKSIPLFENLYSTVYFSFFGLKFYGPWMIPIFTIFYFFCEEIGWRGYALPKLMQRCDVFTASIIIGFVWSLFHISLMNISVLMMHPLLFIFYTINTVMSSLFLSWLYLNTGRSLLLVSLSHAITDTYGSFSPTIISSLGQGPSGIFIFMRFLAYLPIFVLLFKQQKHLKDI